VPGGGPHPKDVDLFSEAALSALRQATSELAFLRRRGYALPGALKLVGDRHQLRERQRTAISRATSEAATAAERSPRQHDEQAAPPSLLGVDGFNVVITVETALNGGVLVTTLDGGLRDLAGVHGSYRISDVTTQALELIAKRLGERGWSDVPTRWLLDAPVSNSGRLAARISEQGEGLAWTVEVVPDPDADLAALEPGQTAATSDAVVLDRCPSWVDLAAETIRRHVPQAWIVDCVADSGSA
jgi:hypothetical protein